MSDRRTILDHLDHVDKLEVAWYGDTDLKPVSVTVECTRCGVVVHDFELELLTQEDEVRLRILTSAISAEKTTFALVELNRQLIHELMGWKERVCDLNDIVSDLLRGDSINISIREGCPVTLGNYDGLNGLQNSRFYEVTDGDVPDDSWWVAVWSYNNRTVDKLQDWLDLTNMPQLELNNITMFVTPFVFGWELEVKGEKFVTAYLPWDLIKPYAQD